MANINETGQEPGQPDSTQAIGNSAMAEVIYLPGQQLSRFQKVLAVGADLGRSAMSWLLAEVTSTFVPFPAEGYTPGDSRSGKHNELTPDFDSRTL